MSAPSSFTFYQVQMSGLLSEEAGVWMGQVAALEADSSTWCSGVKDAQQVLCF